MMFIQTYGRYIMDLIIFIAGLTLVALVIASMVIGALMLLAAFIGAPSGDYDFDLSDDDLL
jgi:hypothetical protein